MRMLLLGLLALTPLAPPPTAVSLPPAAVAPELHREAQDFARLILHYADEMCLRYVRKVERPDLLTAAVAALYEAAQKPVPAGLHDEIAKADEFEVLRILTHHREAAGAAEALKGEQALIVGLKGLARQLDPHSGVVRRDETQRPVDYRQFGPGFVLESAPPPVRPFPPIRGALPGGGFRPGDFGHTPPPLPPAGTPWVVHTVYPGGPAQHAGVRPGDRITHVNGQAVDGPGTDRIAARLFPQEEEEGQPAAVRLTVRRGRDTLAVTLTPGPFDVETVFGVRRKADHSWDFMLDRTNKIGFVRIGTLGHGTAEELDAALMALQADGMRGLVLDLRACPGGLLNTAIEVSRLFLKSGVIARTRNRNGETDNVYRVEGAAGWTPSQVCKVPVVALIGGDTIGGGELIAAALQDNGRARLAGRRTFGKATIQGEPLDLPVPDLVFRYSTGLFVRPSGKNLQRFPDLKSADDWGIRPDPGLAVPISPGLAKQTQEWYQSQILRPGGSREALPLDDPANDPLRQLAVQELVRQLRQPPAPVWVTVMR